MFASVHQWFQVVGSGASGDGKLILQSDVDKIHLAEVSFFSNSKYEVSLYELIKSYAEIKRKQNFSIMNISKLPVYTMEEAIKKITSLLKELTEWRDIKDVVPGSFSGSKNLQKSGLAGTFAGSLELVREGKLSIMQKKNFDKILIKAK